jgi:hypothetical protein
MRLIALLFLACLSTAIYADDVKPSDLKPLPAPPSLDPNEGPDEPQVTITKSTEQTVEEFRSNGKLYMIKVTPKHGKPYYLIDDRGDGKFARQESLDTGLRVPQWVILKF